MTVLEHYVVKTEDVGNGSWVISMAGEGDLYTAPDLQQAFDSALVGGAERVVVDLAAATFIDSTILGVLLRTAKRVRASGGEIVLVCDDRRVLRVFEVTGLLTTFRFEKSLEDATDLPQEAR